MVDTPEFHWSDGESPLRSLDSKITGQSTPDFSDISNTLPTESDETEELKLRLEELARQKSQLSEQLSQLKTKSYEDYETIQIDTMALATLSEAVKDLQETAQWSQETAEAKNEELQRLKEASELAQIKQDSLQQQIFGMDNLKETLQVAGQETQRRAEEEETEADNSMTLWWVAMGTVLLGSAVSHYWSRTLY